MSSMKSDKKGGTKTKIICKYFIQGKCVKGESCPYLHSKVEKPKEIITIECPMYNVGFCKNGRNCCFMHIKKEKYIEEKSDEKNINTNIPMQEEEEQKEQKEKNENNESKKEEEIKYPTIPIWFLEHYYDKPISLLFSELEQKNLPEIIELKKKYGFTNIQPNLPGFPVLIKKNKMNLNMNTLNLNFNNFNMNFALNNNKSEINNKSNNNIIKVGQTSSDKKYDKYEFKKNNNELLLSKQENIYYYLIRCKNTKEIEQSQGSNIISLPLSLSKKLNNIDIQNKTVIIIICDEEYQNFSGFAKVLKPLKEKKEDEKEKENLYNIEWLWRTKLSLSKVNHLMNKADKDNFLIDGKNGCEVDKDLGFFCCRYMMKRLSKEEINELTTEKKMFESEKKLLQNLNNERNNIRNSNSKSNNNSNKDLKYIHNSPYKGSNKKSEIGNTNSTRYSDFKNHVKDKYYTSNREHEDYKIHKYTGHKRYRDYSRSKSKSRSKSINRRDISEDYSNYYNNKNKKYQDKHYNHDYHNGKNYYYNNNNNKFNSNKKNYYNFKENNLYQKSKHNDTKFDDSVRKNNN